VSQPAEQQDVPGIQSKMTPKPDCGEDSYRGSGRLEGKAAVITGGDSGIGRAVAIAYAREGADVLISHLNEDEDAKDTARLVEEAGRRAVLVPGDISRPQHCRHIIARAVSEFGKVDILVANAAYQMTRTSLEDIPDEEWDYTFATNISAMFHLCKAAVPHMGPGSSIIGSSSVNSGSPSPALAPYAATKAAIANLCASLAAVGREGYPGEQRRAGPDLDSPHPRHHATREGGELRQEHAARTTRTTCRAGAGLRPARLLRRQLHLRRPDRGHRRSTDPVTTATPMFGSLQGPEGGP
jgi:NAD(P)-dependent dehydrogenase (short-subunit alcohol dehydrogenase family)